MAADPLQPFWDNKEITDKLGLWCRIVDTRDLTRMPEVFDTEVVWDFGHDTIDHGLEAVVRRINAHLVEDTPCGETHHHLSNIRIDVDGDQAESEAYVFAAHAGTGELAGKTLIMWGNYNDFWRRTPQGWRVVKRLYRIDINDGPMEIVYGSAPKEMWKEGDNRRLG